MYVLNLSLYKYLHQLVKLLLNLFALDSCKIINFVLINYHVHRSLIPKSSAHRTSSLISNIINSTNNKVELIILNGINRPASVY